MKKVSLEDYLSKLYYDPKSLAGFEDARALFKVAKKDKKDVTYDKIEEFLRKQDVYTMNRAVKRNFRRNRVVVSGIDDQWDADLADLSRYDKENEKMKYLLLVIDIFSRYAWAQPIPNKEATTIVNAFDEIIKQGRKPKRLRTDSATDFTSKEFQEYVKKKGINHFTTHGEKQANYVERLIKTIKSKIFKYMIGMNKSKYLDVLQDIMSTYNSSWHSGIKMEPKNVNKENERMLWWQMYWPRDTLEELVPQTAFRYKAGDKVRMSLLPSKLQREYMNKWTGEVFKISERFRRDFKKLYTLLDWFNTPVEGTFYEEELQLVDHDADHEYHIEKILGREGDQVKVKWKYWPEKFNSLIPVSAIKDYTEWQSI